MKIRWTPTALRDLESLHVYIAEEYPEAAAAAVDKVVLGLEALRRHPEMGRAGRVAGTRELAVHPYGVAYRAEPGVTEVLAVIHGARRWPSSVR